MKQLLEQLKSFQQVINPKPSETERKRIKQIYLERRKKPTRGLNVLSLFDGISCGRVALERAGIKVNKYFASEIEPNAIKTTQKNYPDTIQLGDVTKWKEWDLPEIDLIIGGSPCQGFSYAGKQLNFNDPRSKLFFEYVNVLKSVKHKYFLLENVRMKQEFQDIISEYVGFKPIRINSKLVAAQLRDRYYWTNIPNIEQPEDKGIELQDVLEYGYTERKKARCVGEQDSRPNKIPVKMFHRYYSTGFTTLIFESKEHYEKCKSYYDTHFKGLRAEEIMTKPDVFDGVRYMNQSEMEKMQTLPPGYTSLLSRDEAVSVIGNGWTVDVIAHIFKYMEVEKYDRASTNGE